MDVGVFANEGIVAIKLCWSFIHQKKKTYVGLSHVSTVYGVPKWASFSKPQKTDVSFFIKEKEKVQMWLHFQLCFSGSS